MSILIRTDIGGKHGMGHAVRMLALAKELTARGTAVRFLTKTPDLIRFVAPFETHIICGDARVYKPPFSVYIIDTKDPIPDHELIYSRLTGVKVVHIDKPNVHMDLCDMLIGPVKHWDSGVVHALRQDFGERFLYGWDYVMLDESVTSTPPLPYDMRDESLVFCAGGSDPDGAMTRMLAWTDDLDVPSTLLYFMHGQYSHTVPMPRFEATTKRLARYIVPFSRAKLRHASMVVGMFGVTAYECLYYQTPMLCLAHRSDTVRDGRLLGLYAYGAIHGCNTLESYSHASFNEVLLSYWDRESWREHMHSAGLGLIDGQGVKRVSDAIMALI